MWRNPPLSLFASFSIVSLTINQILQEIYLFSWSFIKSTNPPTHQPLTNWPLTTYSPTDQPTTDPLSHQLKYHQPKQTWYHFKDLIIKKVFILTENKHSWENVKLYFGLLSIWWIKYIIFLTLTIFKGKLLSVKDIRRS